MNTSWVMHHLQDGPVNLKTSVRPACQWNPGRIFLNRAFFKINPLTDAVKFCTIKRSIMNTFSLALTVVIILVVLLMENHLEVGMERSAARAF